MLQITRILIGILCISGLFISTPASASELRDSTDNRTAPPLELMGLDDKPHSLDGYIGKVLLVNFWAGWCHPCLQEIPELINLSKELSGQPFAILAVNVGEEKSKLPGFTKKMAEHMVILLDRESVAFKAWEGIGLPSSFVVDKTGHIRYEAYGAVNWDAEYIVRSFEELMAEDPVAAENSAAAE